MISRKRTDLPVPRHRSAFLKKSRMPRYDSNTQRQTPNRKFDVERKRPTMTSLRNGENRQTCTPGVENVIFLHDQLKDMLLLVTQ
jgi:hypothetical protein